MALLIFVLVIYVGSAECVFSPPRNRRSSDMVQVTESTNAIRHPHKISNVNIMNSDVNNDMSGEYNGSRGVGGNQEEYTRNDDTPSSEKLVITHLMSEYGRVGRQGRPVRNISHTVQVHFGLGLIHMELDEKDKILTMSVWTRYKWEDTYLTWDPQAYDGIDTVRLPPHLIWKPDITLYNSASTGRTSRDALVVIQSNGSISWFPHSIYKFSCSVDVTNFPFDHQQCYMWFGSWTHPESEIDLQMSVKSGIDLSTFQEEYKESCGWDIYNVSAHRKIVQSKDGLRHYVMLAYAISIERKMMFSSYILTLPCVFLACLTLVVFCLPPDRPDRTALAMSLFASFMFLLLILVEAAPPTTSTIPKLGIYYSFNMVLIMLAVILSSLVINISRVHDSPVPRHLRVIIFRLSQMLCLQTETTSNNHVELLNKTNGMTSSTKHSRAKLGHEEGISPNTGTSAGVTMSILQSIRDLSGALRLRPATANGQPQPHSEPEIHQTYGTADREEPVMGWTYVAYVMDRFFFVLYLVLITLSLFWLFPKPMAPDPIVKAFNITL